MKASLSFLVLAHFLFLFMDFCFYFRLFIIKFNIILLRASSSTNHWQTGEHVDKDYNQAYSSNFRVVEIATNGHVTLKIDIQALLFRSTVGPTSSL